MIGRLLLSSLLLLLPNKVAAQISSTTCPGAGCVTQNVAGQGSAGVQVSGTFVGTITFYGSINNTTYVAINLFPPTSTTGVSTTTGAGLWTGSIAGLSSIRIGFSAYTSGTANVTIRTQQSAKANIGSGGGGGSIACATSTGVLYGSTGACSTNLIFDDATGFLTVTTTLGIAQLPGLPPTLTAVGSYQGRFYLNSTADLINCPTCPDFNAEAYIAPYTDPAGASFLRISLSGGGTITFADNVNDVNPGGAVDISTVDSGGHIIVYQQVELFASSITQPTWSANVGIYATDVAVGTFGPSGGIVDLGQQSGAGIWRNLYVGTSVRPDNTSGHTYSLAVFDNDTGPDYVNWVTSTNGNTPSVVIAPPAGGTTISIQATTYKSSDGTTGVTVTTCTGYKNGLCISGT